MRGKMHSANKKISMIRSKSMERFSKKQELIVVTPRIKTVEAEDTEEFSGPFIGQAIAITDFTPNPYDREALRLRRGDIIDVAGYAGRLTHCIAPTPRHHEGVNQGVENSAAG